MLTAKCTSKWADLAYGVPNPRFIRPLVRINAMVEDAPQGYILDPCFLPPTILQLDECEMTLRVNDALLDLKPLLPCFQVAAGSGVPTGTPSQGYLPFYVDYLTKALWVFAGGSWIQTNS